MSAIALPLVAIVGRPNVGKSTLFNRLIRSRRAIVQDDPGVTRDRHYGTTELEGRRITLVDTGGLEPGACHGIESLVRQQTQFAIDESDLVLLVMDARDGITSSDRAVVEALRRTGKPTLQVVNKTDGPRQELGVSEFYSLGAEQIFPISAEHGLGFDDLIDAMLAALPSPPPVPDPTEGEELMRIALVGRPNAGKSSLLNRLVGAERSIVAAEPGTTRDPVDVLLPRNDGPVMIVDTAGIRRRRNSGTPMEQLAVIRALRSVDRADVACLVMDASQGVAEQDAKVAGLAAEAGRALVLVFTKSDLIPTHGSARRKLREEVAEKLQFVTYAPLLFLSSVTGTGVGRLIPTARRVHQQAGQRVPTGELNRFLEGAVASHPPPSHHGRQVRFYFMVQPETRPPTFLVSTNLVEGVHFTYRRYLANRLRERYGFEGTPLRLFFRQRGLRDKKDRK